MEWLPDGPRVGHVVEVVPGSPESRVQGAVWVNGKLCVPVTLWRAVRSQTA